MDVDKAIFGGDEAPLTGGRHMNGPRGMLVMDHQGREHTRVKSNDRSGELTRQ